MAMSSTFFARRPAVIMRMGSIGLRLSSTRASASKHMDSSLSVLYVTVPDSQVADELGTKLVEESLAACVNIIPGITSIYKWEGKMTKDSELLLMIKTKTSLVEPLTNFVRANHPYDNPEVISVPVTGGSEAYMNWVLAGTKGG
jgi:periplasmic divalent cation tolerance protein